MPSLVLHLPLNHLAHLIPPLRLLNQSITTNPIIMQFSTFYVAIVAMAAAAFAAPVPEAAVTAACGFNRNSCKSSS